MDHIWTIQNWKNIININDEKHRTGLRLRCDNDINPEVRRACKEFCAFLRKKYFFPMRVNVYVKSAVRIVARDGSKVCGTFLRTEYHVEPYARIATGDYMDLCKRWGKDRALIEILFNIAHELTHYFQWINDLPLTKIGEERQATVYARYILDEYFETREHL